jgi:pyridoxine 5'-phosphate synthase PdxJ
MAATEEMLEIALRRTRRSHARRGKTNEITTEGGLDAKANIAIVRAVDRCARPASLASLVYRSDPEQIEVAQTSARSRLSCARRLMRSDAWARAAFTAKERARRRTSYAG